MEEELIASEKARRRGGVRMLWHWLTGGNRTKPQDQAKLSPSDLRFVRTVFREIIAGSGGEVSARRRIELITRLYRKLSGEGRTSILEILTNEFGPDERMVKRGIQAYLDTANDAARRRAEAGLRQALASPRIPIFKKFNLLPDGVKFLVDLRADVLHFMRSHPEFAAIDDELFDLLSSWFDIGNLDLRRISWNSPATLLEKLISYEAVHEIRSWNDLRNRLDSDRRCYAFFHPRMPEEPLIFVEIALVHEMADNIHHLLDEEAPALEPRDAQVAIFYSISNTQVGLRGVAIGGFLIKRVVEQLMVDFPKLKTFATLSPIPGFGKWLDERVRAGDDRLIVKADHAKLCAAGKVQEPTEAFRVLMSGEWQKDTGASVALQPVLTRLVARYLALEKDKDRPVDPVTRFHLGNGARIERINWLADISPRGLKQGAGFMVNYLYNLSDIEENHEAYAREGRVIVSSSVKRLLQTPS
jgi:malonyl-CoA decarboxylase